MDFTTETRMIINMMEKLSKMTDDYGCGDRHERGKWEAIKITPDEIWINIGGLVEEGTPTPNIVITNQDDKDYPFKIVLYDATEPPCELSEPTITGPYKSLKETFLLMGDFIIANLL